MNTIFQNRSSLPEFSAIFVLFSYIFQKYTSFEVPPPVPGSVTQHTHVQHFLLVDFFSPSAYLHFGSGLRSISLFYSKVLPIRSRHRPQHGGKTDTGELIGGIPHL